MRGGSGSDLDALVGTLMERRRTVRAQTAALRARLPLRYLNQAAHFTTPAADLAVAQKAVLGGYAATPRLLARWRIEPTDIAAALDVPLTDVEATLAVDPRAPLVLIDGEDAQALRDDVIARGRANAVQLFTELDWGPTLRFYRPSGLNLDSCVHDLVDVLIGAARTARDRYPIDGIIFPKVEHPCEIEWVCEALGQIERTIGLTEHQIKLEFLVESGWAVANLTELVRRSLDRLVGIVFGIADYAADLGLPAIEFTHPVCDWARAHIVNIAGAVGVPAIDAMTLNYPVADPGLGEVENRARLLARIKACYDDARRGMALGFAGKWVGHPLQLFAVMLAARQQLRPEQIEAEVAKIETYARAVAAETGVTVIEGAMSDRATDRHARMLLRRAAAAGQLDPSRAQALGIISSDEAAALRSATSRRS